MSKIWGALSGFPLLRCHCIFIPLVAILSSECFSPLSRLSSLLEAFFIFRSTRITYSKQNKNHRTVPFATLRFEPWIQHPWPYPHSQSFQLYKKLCAAVCAVYHLDILSLKISKVTYIEYQEQCCCVGSFDKILVKIHSSPLIHIPARLLSSCPPSVI